MFSRHDADACNTQVGHENAALMNEKRTQPPLKTGEKIMFIVAGAFVLLALLGFIAMLIIQSKSDKPLFETKTHFELSEEGKKGSEAFRLNGCTTCHRALRNGTNMGRTAELDGIGSRRTLQWIEAFLADPEKNYGAPTVDHGATPKRADYVSRLPAETRHQIAVFLSELKSERGSSTAEAPPEGRSEFIDSMVKTWAPAEWKEKYRDVREKETSERNHDGANTNEENRP